MVRLIAKLICFAIGCLAGWAVQSNLSELLDNWVPFAGAGLTAAAVFIMLYFPLLRPIADMISERLMVMKQSTRHLRSGTGIGDIPTLEDPTDETPSPQQVCAICGSPADSPVCESCQRKMSR